MSRSRSIHLHQRLSSQDIGKRRRPFLCRRQHKVGQKELPDLKGDVVPESAFDMDSSPAPRPDNGYPENRYPRRLPDPGGNTTLKAITNISRPSTSSSARRRSKSDNSSGVSGVWVPFAVAGFKVSPIDSRRSTGRADRMAVVILQGNDGRCGGEIRAPIVDPVPAVYNDCALRPVESGRGPEWR